MAQTLEAIEKHLGNHRSVRVTKTKKHNLLAMPNYDPLFPAHRTCIWVGVNIDGLRGLWHPEYLNDLQESLIPPGVEPTEYVPFVDGYANWLKYFAWLPYDALYLGRLRFEEEIGSVRGTKEYVLTDKSLWDTPDFENGVRKKILKETPLVGLIEVRLWPCVGIAKEAEKRKDEWKERIPLAELTQYRE